MGGFTGTMPTLWCTLRGFPKDTQRTVIQNFNLSMLAGDHGHLPGRRHRDTRHAAAVRHRGARHAGAHAAGHPDLHRHQ
jgi:hypothetical protein